MHKLTSSRSVIALRLGSLTLILSALLFAAAIGVIGYGFYTNDPGITLKGLYGVILSLGVFIASKILTHSAYCPLCRGPVLRGSGARRHRTAKRSFFSYRLRVARDITLTNTFVCPYCGERTHCVVKPRYRTPR